ncbi:MAG: adenylate/guanylate cyclase domain-containing protein [Spirochaetes bacterium]|jgi:class 3 adenylate cyclase|nr:adenylate/guanylate cyclase domain-containing protein [Spirochaetota bacterium]
MKNRIACLDSTDVLNNLNSTDHFHIERVDPTYDNLITMLHNEWSLILINVDSVENPYFLIKKIKNSSSHANTKVLAYTHFFNKISEIKSRIYSADHYSIATEIHEDLLLNLITDDSFTNSQNNVSTVNLLNRDSEKEYNRILINEELLNLLLKPKDIPNVAFQILELLNLVCIADVSVLIINSNENSKAYIVTNNNIHTAAFQDFFKFCQHDHYSHFNFVNIGSIERIFKEDSDIENTITNNFNKKLINSYSYMPLAGSSGTICATIHLGNFSNNYFSNETISSALEHFSDKAGSVIDMVTKIDYANNQHKELKSLFSKFLPEEIINELISENAQSRKNERKNLAVLFSDIRAFTTITEMNPPDAVIQFLNIYFDEMVQCIKKFDGIIDKYIGDAIVAIFGMYDDADSASDNALKAASEMMKRQRDIDTKNINLPSNGFKIGIGIHYGESIVGNIGSEEKMTYTIVGEISSIAEALESETKNSASILFSQALADTLIEMKNSIAEIGLDKEDYGKVYSLKSEIELCNDRHKDFY